MRKIEEIKAELTEIELLNCPRACEEESFFNWKDWKIKRLKSELLDALTNETPLSRLETIFQAERDGCDFCNADYLLMRGSRMTSDGTHKGCEALVCPRCGRRLDADPVKPIEFEGDKNDHIGDVTDMMPLTNADRIRAMSDEDLAKIIVAEDVAEKIPFCKNLPQCDVDLETQDGIPQERCIQCALDWLRSKPKEATNEKNQ